jgi:hypothetical protein
LVSEEIHAIERQKETSVDVSTEPSSKKIDADVSLQG